MRFSPQFLDELRARLPVSEVVGRRVKLIRSGREMKGLSPFNKEKTPSFFVNDAKMMWFDFSSGKNGNIFDFLIETEGVSFPEAVERLAQLAGVPLPKVVARGRGARGQAQVALRGHGARGEVLRGDACRRAPAPRRAAILPTAASIRRRNSNSVSAMRSGERYALKEHLGGHGVPVPDMIEAGLLVAGDDIPVPYDRFRDRVIFPITDLRGRIIAFGGRALEKDVPAKYLNSPETPLFHKGGTLYNIAAAREAAHAAAHDRRRPSSWSRVTSTSSPWSRAGFAATVAPLGTALTEDQLGLALEDGRRAGALFRRRRRRRARRLSRGRSGAAAAQARQEPEIRAAAAGPGSRTISCARPDARRSPT